ncbi:MAG: hypothetical protein Q7S17_06510 [Xanthobacteraceae bacterium]|nr:hypothetical protein [Xanthobacteraceae bacterium]
MTRRFAPMRYGRLAPLLGTAAVFLPQFAAGLLLVVAAYGCAMVMP